MTCFSVDSANTHAIPTIWKTLISNDCDIDEKKLHQNYHVKVARILSTDKLSSKKIYSILISNIVNKPASNIDSKNCLKTQL